MTVRDPQPWTPDHSATLPQDGPCPASGESAAVLPERRFRWKLSRVAFYLHLWAGVLSAVVLLTVSVTGILLNHKRGLGLMPEVEHAPTAPFASALPLERLVARALAAAPSEAVESWSSGDALDLSLVDRMDVRPRNGYVKVRLRDAASTEVTLDLATGEVLDVGRRGDVFLEKLHSGEAFGASFVLLSDLGALGMVLTLLTGYWLWLAPKSGRSTGTRVAREAP